MKNAIENIGIALFFILIALLVAMVWIDFKYFDFLFNIIKTISILLVACIITVNSYEDKGGSNE